MIYFKTLFDKGYWKINRQPTTHLQKIKIYSFQLLGGIIGILSFGYISFWGDIVLGMKYNAMATKKPPLPTVEDWNKYQPLSEEFKEEFNIE